MNKKKNAQPQRGFLEWLGIGEFWYVGKAG